MTNNFEFRLPPPDEFVKEIQNKFVESICESYHRIVETLLKELGVTEENKTEYQILTTKNRTHVVRKGVYVGYIQIVYEGSKATVESFKRHDPI